MTYRYRIYTFQNGLGETVFRAKHVSHFFSQWINSWVSVGIADTSDKQRFSRTEWLYSKWENRGTVLAAIQEDAEQRNRKRLYRMGNTLKLVITEDVPVEVSP